jgi:hypothetical protein
MSLDVYLEVEETLLRLPAIPIREGGQVKQITREEWNTLYPGREPITMPMSTTHEVYWANITHNLNKMAEEAGLYEYLWRPDEIGIETAAELIEPLKAGLARLRADPDHFRQFNPSNGWGSYEALVEFVERYLHACRDYPHATVKAWR